MTWTLLQGEVRDKLAEIPEKSVQTCVTSPPYWGLRDYGAEGQLGLEPTPEEYVANMVEVFRGVKRALRDDGTVWLNLGDSYNAGRDGGHPGGKAQWKPEQQKYAGRSGANAPGLKPKDLCMIPFDVARALRDDGWYLRSDIIWHKPNPMPESVTDRPTKSHEYIFLLSKSQKYFYDAEAIKEPANYAGQDRGKSRNISVAGMTEMDNKQYDFRNKRSVWTVNTKSYKEAHFATFPPKLIEPCILAGTSPQACEICGAPWRRVVEKSGGMERDRTQEEGLPEDMRGHGIRKLSGKTHADWKRENPDKVLGWQPTCTCDNKGTGRSIVLDPFAGSGTTLYVAEQHGRDSIGIELNPEYAELVRKRMDNMQQTIFNL